MKRSALFLFLGIQILSFNTGAMTCRAETESDTALLSEEQKQEKRLLFSQYVENERARREAEAKKSQVGAQEETKVISKLSPSYGYESNIESNSRHRGDGFLHLAAEGEIKIDRPEIPALKWPGKIGISWYADTTNYESYETYSYNSDNITVFTEEMPTDRIKLRLQYEFGVLRYYDNNTLNYISHKVKPSLTYYFSKVFSTTFFVSDTYRRYDRRGALSDSNTYSDDGRRDDYYEVGINPKFYPSDRTYIGATAALKKNDTNDLFQQYNDYDGWKASAFLYQKLFGNYSTVLLGGYDYKKFKGRTFDATLEKEHDDFFYLGSYLYYDFNAHWQGSVSYLYKQNNSNSPLLEYSGYTVSGGMTYSF